MCCACTMHSQSTQKSHMQKLQPCRKLQHNTAVLINMDPQVQRVLELLDQRADAVQRFLLLRTLQRCERYSENTPTVTTRLPRVSPQIFHAVLTSAAERVLPYIYTPTIGAVCQRYFHLPITSNGCWLDATMSQDTMLHTLRSHPLAPHVRIIVVTDGHRILGLGDLGAGGMGICEGKSLLYTVAAAVPPHTILPVMLDVGTDNVQLRDEDGAYRGLRTPRLHGNAHSLVMDTFMQAVQRFKPHILVQFEDFANANAFALLQRYGTTYPCFNDDIQGTACVTVAVLLAAARRADVCFSQRPVLFLGAGEAGTGIADLLSLHLADAHGMSMQRARRQSVFFDSKGLVCSRRNNLQAHKLPYAHDDVPPCRSLLEAIHALRPAALVGVSTQAGAFDAHVLSAMAAVNARPIVLPLSNPTACAECTFAEAVAATEGRVLFASGSPFDSVEVNGVVYHPDQANNAYVFPAIGHATVVTCATTIPEQLFLHVARTLATLAPVDRLLPRFDAVLNASACLMAAACAFFVEHGLGQRPDDFEVVVAQWRLQGRGGEPWEAYCRSRMTTAAWRSRL